MSGWNYCERILFMSQSKEVDESAQLMCLL